MDTVILNNGVEMPMLGIGTSGFEGDACELLVRQALELGCRLIDTAQSYRNESAVGRALRQSGVRRGEVFLATKLTIANTTYEGARESLKRSLDRLGVASVDLLLLQYPYNDVFGAWRALVEMQEEGLVAAIGVCNFAADRLADLVLHVRKRPQVAQFERHPYFQRPNVMAYLRRQDIQPVARGPFATAKNGELLADPVIGAIAHAHACTPAQVLLRWQIDGGAVVIPQVRPEHLEEVFSSAVLPLTPEEQDAIAALERDESAMPPQMQTPEWIEKLCHG